MLLASLHVKTISIEFLLAHFQFSSLTFNLCFVPISIHSRQVHVHTSIHIVIWKSCWPIFELIQWGSISGELALRIPSSISISTFIQNAIPRKRNRICCNGSEAKTRRWPTFLATTKAFAAVVSMYEYEYSYMYRKVMNNENEEKRRRIWEKSSTNQRLYKYCVESIIVVGKAKTSLPCQKHTPLLVYLKKIVDKSSSNGKLIFILARHKENCLCIGLMV